MLNNVNRFRALQNNTRYYIIITLLLTTCTIQDLQSIDWRNAKSRCSIKTEALEMQIAVLISPSTPIRTTFPIKICQKI